MENAVGFLRRNIMVPMLNAESHGQLTRYMLERCDAMAKETHYRKGAPIGGCSPVRRWICSRFPPSRTTRSVGR